MYPDVDKKVAEELLKEVYLVIAEELTEHRQKLEDELARCNYNYMIISSYMAGYDKAISLIKTGITEIENEATNSN